MGTIAKVAHLSFDLVVFSAFLAGVRRNTGLTLDTDKFGNETILEYTKKYLDIGEKTFDYTSAWFGSSDFFKRK